MPTYSTLFFTLPHLIIVTHFIVLWNDSYEKRFLLKIRPRWKMSARLLRASTNTLEALSGESAAAGVTLVVSGMYMHQTMRLTLEVAWSLVGVVMPSCCFGLLRLESFRLGLGVRGAKLNTKVVLEVDSD